MSEISEALELVEQTLKELKDAGWESKAEFPDTPEGGSAEVLFYVRHFLTWHTEMESFEGTMVALDQSGREQAAFEGLTRGARMAVNAVLAADDTIESVLEMLPDRIERARTFLDGPPKFPLPLR